MKTNFKDIAYTFFGIIYVVMLIMFFAKINGMENGNILIWYVMRHTTFLKNQQTFLQSGLISNRRLQGRFFVGAGEYIKWQVRHLEKYLPIN